MKKRIIAALMAVMAISLILSGCTSHSKTKKDSGNNNGKLNIVTTLFPYYDFARQIAGDKADISLIVPAGMDTHSFEPTTEDIINIQKADMFIYNGGTLENWVSKVLKSIDNNTQARIKMMDFVDLLTEEHKEGMEDAHGKHDDHEEDEEIDEHIWTSPANAKILVTEICSSLKTIDPENSDYYQANYDAYINSLTELDEDFHNVTDNARVKTLIFADKFPLRYFTEEYGLDYYAAFSGCSTDTEPSVDTVKFLIDKVKSEKINTVYYLELSSQKIADTICSSTGAGKKIFYSCHNVTAKQFDEGITYLDMMRDNLETLKEGLK